MLQGRVAEGEPRSYSQVVSLAVQDGGLSGLKVYVGVAGSFGGGWFFARMTNDGRLTIPKLALKLSAR
jgi:hypothetical protein